MYTNFINAAFVFYGIAFWLYLFAFTKKIIHAFAYGLLLAGAVNNLLAILIRWHELGYFYLLSGVHEVMVFLGFLFAAGCLLVDFLFNLQFALGAFGAFFSLIALGYASLLGNSIEPLIPQLKSNWLIIHVTSYLLGYAADFIAFVAGILYLVKSRRSVINKNRETLKNFDKLGYRSVMTSFPLLTIGLTTGSVWADVAWARYWGWDPKETWALITWLIYVIYIHAYLKGWRGRKMAWIAIAGFAAILFAAIGVTFFMTGLHSY